jgi:ribonuclease D
MSYLVDVLALDTTQPKTALDPLKRVLEDPSITKVLYDCRNDAGALWREQQCRLQVGGLCPVSVKP